MAIQDDINSFINKAKQATVLLGMNLLSAQQNGQNELARHDIWLINKLSSAIIGLTNPNNFTTGEIYSIISYYNNLANLNQLGIAYINPTAPEYLIENKFIFVPGDGIYLLAANNLSDVQNRAQSRANLGLAIGSNVQAWNTKLDAFSALANSAGVLQNDGSGNYSWTSALTNSLNSGNIFVGNASNVATSVSISGDTSLSNTGVLSVNKFNGQLPSYYLLTSNMVEGSNLFFTNARGIGATLTGYVSGAGTISPTDSVLSAIQKLNGNISALVTGVSSFNTRTGAITLTSSDVTTALGFTPIQLSSLSGNSPLSYNNTSGAFSISQATTSTNGYVSSTDWNTFNAKVGSITLNTPNVVFSNPVTFSVTSGAASGTLSLNTQSAGRVFIGPSSGSPATPTFRNLVATDIPALSGTYVDLSSTQTAAGTKTWSNTATFSSGLNADNINANTTDLTIQGLAQTGTNVRGKNIIIEPGLGTGGTPSTEFSSLIVFPTTLFNATSTSAQTYIDNIIFGSTDVSAGVRTQNFGWSGIQRASISSSNFLWKTDNAGETVLNSGPSNQLSLATAGTDRITLTSSLVTISPATTFSSNVTANSAIQCANYSSLSAGSAIQLLPQAQTTSNTAGGNTTIGAGVGNGTAALSQILFKAPNTNTSGIVQVNSTIASMDGTNGNMFNSINTGQVTLIARGFGVGGSYTQTVDLFKAQSYNGTSPTDLFRINNNGDHIHSGGLIFLNSVPSSNPSSGTIYVYYDSGNLKARSYNGTITTIAAL